MAVIASLAAGCGTDAVVLPPDFNAKKVKKIDIFYNVDDGTVRNFAGVQGGPQKTLHSDASLLDDFLRAGIDLMRVPDGYLCDYAMSGIFPDAGADPTKNESYSFQKIDEVVGAASQIPVGADEDRRRGVVFQAEFDLGKDTCTVSPDGIQTGAPPKDLAKWTQAVVATLKHFQSANFNVRHVEFIEDPLGRGGYTNVGLVADHLVAFAEAVKAAFPNTPDGKPTMGVIGPSIPVGSAAEVPGHALTQLIDELRTRKKEGLIDALAFQTAVESPAENLAIAEALRKMLTERQLDKVKLWATRYEPNRTTHPVPGPQEDTTGWSSYAGAFATASKILWQDALDAAIFYRGDRRQTTKEQGDINAVEQSPLWASTGESRTAGIAWQPWRLMVDKQRVLVGEIADTDRSGLAVMAARGGEPTDCCTPSPTKCKKLYVLIANANTQLNQKAVSYQVHVDGVADPAAASQQVTVCRSIINEATTEFKFADSRLVSLVGGGFYYNFDSSVPATEYLEVDLGP